MKPPLRLVIVDDHEIVRRGVRSLLKSQKGWEVVGEAATVKETVERVRRLQPDVVVLDIALGAESGLDAAREIARIRPETEIVILTLSESPEVVRDVVAAGASAYVSKADAESELIQAVRSVVRRRPYFSSRGSGLVAEAWREDASGGGRREDGPAKTPSLTPRQLQIVRLLAEGASNKDVGEALGISVKTAETHRANIMRRLRLSSLSHLVRYAIREGLVTD